MRVSYPFAHQAVVEWEANEPEGRLLDEVGIEDSDLGWLAGDVVCHRLPETLCAPLRKQRSEQNRSEKGKSSNDLFAGRGGKKKTH